MQLRPKGKQIHVVYILSGIHWSHSNATRMQISKVERFMSESHKKCQMQKLHTNYAKKNQKTSKTKVKLHKFSQKNAKEDYEKAMQIRSKKYQCRMIKYHKSVSKKVNCSQNQSLCLVADSGARSISPRVPRSKLGKFFFPL